MCRFIFYLGDAIALSTLLTEPAHSLIQQSYASRERSDPLNGDGFGVAWYADNDPQSAVFKSISPAWNNSNLLNIARVTRSHCVLAHVRDATQGLAVSQSNCHPFRNNNLTFAHNGDIGGFKQVRRHLLSQLSDDAFNSIQGTTDSEHFFALFQDNYRDVEHETEVAALASALQTTITQVVALSAQHANGTPCYFNIAITDGSCAVVCRFTSDKSESAASLYVNTGKRYLCENGACIMSHAGGPQDKAIVVSSEPLSHDENWASIEPQSMLLIESDLSTAVRAIT
ncbi:MAG: class II glutamine amidotransferase [Pseudomonadota bacterium]